MMKLQLVILTVFLVFLSVVSARRSNWGRNNQQDWTNSWGTWGNAGWNQQQYPQQRGYANDNSYNNRYNNGYRGSYDGGYNGEFNGGYNQGYNDGYVSGLKNPYANDNLNTNY